MHVVLRLGRQIDFPAKPGLLAPAAGMMVQLRKCQRTRSPNFPAAAAGPKKGSLFLTRPTLAQYIADRPEELAWARRRRIELGSRKASLKLHIQQGSYIPLADACSSASRFGSPKDKPESCC